MGHHLSYACVVFNNIFIYVFYLNPHDLMNCFTCFHRPLPLLIGVKREFEGVGGELELFF